MPAHDLPESISMSTSSRRGQKMSLRVYLKKLFFRRTTSSTAEVVSAGTIHAEDVSDSSTHEAIVDYFAQEWTNKSLRKCCLSYKDPRTAELKCMKAFYAKSSLHVSKSRLIQAYKALYAITPDAAYARQLADILSLHVAQVVPDDMDDPTELDQVSEYQERINKDRQEIDASLEELRKLRESLFGDESWVGKLSHEELAKLPWGYRPPLSD